MDEREVWVQHLLDHYVQRDIFRGQISEFIDRNRSTYGGGVYAFDVWRMIGSISMFDHNGKINQAYYRDTKRRLGRSKLTTLRYLHDLLHADEYLDEHKHWHEGSEIFTFLIQEDSHG